MKWIAIYTVYALLISAVSGQDCTDTVGSLSHDSNIVTAAQTFILAGYTIPCNGTVIAWEFCYRVVGVTSVTFYPGIWRINGTMGVTTDYELIQSNSVTYDASIQTSGFDGCQRVNLSTTDRFTAPAGSVVGLYSKAGVQLLHTNTDSSITTYRLIGNQSSVSVGNNNDVNYNIAIRVHLVDLPATTSTAITSTATTSTAITSTAITSTAITSTAITSIAITSTAITSTAITSIAITSTAITSTITESSIMPTTENSTITADSSSYVHTIVTVNSYTNTDSSLSMPTITTIKSSTNMASSSDTSTSSTITIEASSSNNTQTGGENSSSSVAVIVAGVVAGCVLGIVVCAIIVVLLVWYQRRRRSWNKGTQGAVSSGDLAGSNRFSDHQYYQMRRKNGYEPVVNGMIITNNEAVYETADNCGYYLSDSNSSYYSSVSKSDQSSERKVYTNPNTITVKDHPKLASGDYEHVPNLDASHYEMACQYKEPIPPTIRDNLEYAEPLPFNEPLYEDPGHKKQKIYAWFEKKKFRKLERNDIQILQALGSGEFGTVHLGLWSSGPVQVAVKTLNSQCSESDRVKFLREAAIMGQFVHNNVVQLHGVVTEEVNMMIVLEYMPKGDLRDNLMYLKTSTTPEGYSKLKHDLLKFCRQIAAGMNYLANKQFIHRDLAARNILVSSDDVCKIADFGMARDVSDDTYYIIKGGKLPVKWTAPEAMFYKKYSLQSDVWSFGCVMYEIWSLGHKPAEGIDEYLEKITTGYRLPPPPGCPRAMYELMIQCWHPTARSRPLAGSVLQTLQNSDSTLLTSSAHVTEDKITEDNQSMMLGASLTAGNQLYLDLQQRYTTR